MMKRPPASGNTYETYRRAVSCKPEGDILDDEFVQKIRIKKISWSIKLPTMIEIREDFELPKAISDWGWEYHHLGVPTSTIMPGEKYLPQFKFYVSGFPTSPFGIEWMRFEDDSPMSYLIKTVPHIAFVVKDLDYELSKRDFNILTPPNPPSEGVRVAMIEHNGAPIELIEFEKQHPR
jgi:hypothetical protein